MRLNLESGYVESSAVLLVVTGVIDWSTIAQFRAGLSRLVSGPRPDALVAATGCCPGRRRRSNCWPPLREKRACTVAGVSDVRVVADPRVAGGRLRPAGP